MSSIFRVLCLPKNIIPVRYAIQVNNYAAPGMKTLGKGVSGKKGGVSQRMVYPVEEDTKKLVTYVCGSNYYKEGEDIKLKPDSEYPDWLWTLPVTPIPLEEMDPNTKHYGKSSCVILAIKGDSKGEFSHLQNRKITINIDERLDSVFGSLYGSCRYCKCRKQGRLLLRLCTHLIYTFAGLGQDDSLKVLDPWQDLPNDYGKNGYGRFNALRQLNPNVKTMIAVGGWNEGSTKYSQVVANPARRAKFVDSIVNFLEKYGFDGFDVDWEYPNQRGGKPEDKQNYIAFLKELREKFEPHGYLLSAAVGAAESSASQSYNIREMSKYLHFINLMTYDLHGSWESSTGINAPLYAKKGAVGNQAKLTVDASIQYWLDQGAPADKLILGVPFYGRSFTLQNPQTHDVGAPTTGPGTAGPFTREPGMLGYNEICTGVQSGEWTVVFDEDQRTPYAYKGNQWVGYDDIKSLTEKAEYIKAKKLGGAMLWSIETDDFQGACGEKYPLLKTLNHVLRGGEEQT
ncbi:hypothetical protein KPH14_012451 [Odynerus spinipes]|uniref:GH18 domain-containing protein n=1 Tax=Odynerus spinipes TaxID=1348599 RepID=A0AAD9RI88_9HYME|nr:hypothetical protein KPH14_012451 [Odynerus spinipes]